MGPIIYVEHFLFYFSNFPAGAMETWSYIDALPATFTKVNILKVAYVYL